jgi:hypothetical protein
LNFSEPFLEPILSRFFIGQVFRNELVLCSFFLFPHVFEEEFKYFFFKTCEFLAFYRKSRHSIPINKRNLVSINRLGTIVLKEIIRSRNRNHLTIESPSLGFCKRIVRDDHALELLFIAEFFVSFDEFDVRASIGFSRRISIPRSVFWKRLTDIDKYFF